MRAPGNRRERGRLGSRYAGLPRRRRTLLAVVTGLVVAAAAASAVVALIGGGDRPYGATGSGGPPQNRLGPVLLVPGYGGSTSALDTLAARIRAGGRAATVIQLPGAGTGSLLADAALLNSAVDSYLHQGAPSVDVVGYSAGGVVALIWARHDDGAARARRIVTLGSPFHGTRLAAEAEAVAPGACPAACQQLVPGSPLLDGLGVTDPAGLPHWLSLWTSDDQVVTPPDSAQLAGAINVGVQSLCPAARISHSELPTSPVVVAMVLRALGRGQLARPTAASCGVSS